MQQRLVVVAAALVLVGAACSSPGSTSTTTTTTVRETTPTPTSVAPTTNPPVTETDPPNTTSVSGDPGAPGLGDDYFPLLGNGGYDAGHYLIELSIDPGAGSLAGTVSIDATATANLSSFNLDFEGPDISSVVVDEETATFTREGGELVVTPVSILAAGTDFLVEISYAGIPEPSQTVAVPFPIGWRNTPTYLFTASEPDGSNSWYPVNDHPLDKATYTFRLTVPQPLTAVANGLLTEVQSGENTTRFTWEASDPMASYLTLIAVGEFAEVVPLEPSPVSVRSYLPPEIAADPPESMDLIPEMIAYFESLFGPYPFEAFGVVVVDGFETALETQTLPIFGLEIFLGSILETVLVHELVHQWFGNNVSPATWQDIWLNEGFATFGEWLWEEHTSGLNAYQNRALLGFGSVSQTRHPRPGNPGPTDMFAESVYVRGALTLYALRKRVGSDAFFAVLREFHDRFGGGTATTGDFVAVAEEISGEDLGELFDSWLYASEMPTFPSVGGV